MSTKHRILFITDTYVGGSAGSERHLYQLVSKLEEEDYDIDLIQLTSKTAIPLRQGLLDNKKNIRVEHHPVGRIYSFNGIGVFLRLRRRILDGRYNIVQSLHEKSDLINAFLPARRGGIRKISSRRDMGFKKGKFLKHLFRKLNSRFDIIVAPSAAIIRDLIDSENVCESQARIVMNGVDLSRFKSLDSSIRGDIRRELNIGPEVNIVGCVANLKPVKGHRYLIEGFANFVRDYSNSALLLIGEGECRNQLEILAANLGVKDKVVFLGQRSDVDRILNIVDVIVSSSLSEGMSNALIEASASGIPIIATDVGGNSEIVEDNHTGFIVPSQDSAAIGQALCQYFGNKVRYKDFAKNARLKMEAEFSIARMISGYQNLYDSCVNAQLT